jgi:hypothetical protein
VAIALLEEDDVTDLEFNNEFLLEHGQAVLEQVATIRYGKD